MKYNTLLGKLLILSAFFTILFGTQSAVASTRYTFTCPKSADLKKSFFHAHVYGDIVKLRGDVPQTPVPAKGRLHGVKVWGSFSVVAIRIGHDAKHQIWCGYGNPTSEKDNAVTIIADIAPKEASCVTGREERTVVCTEN